MATGQTNDTGFKAFLAGEALEAFRRVKVTTANTRPATVVYADAGDVADAVTTEKVANAEYVSCRLKNAGGTVAIETVTAIGTPGITLYGALDGKVSTAEVGEAEWKSLEAASGSGSILECLCKYIYTPAS